MNAISVSGLDLAKNVFQLHAVSAAGQVDSRKTLRRGDVSRFFAGQLRVIEDVTDPDLIREILNHRKQRAPPRGPKPREKNTPDSP